MSPERNSREDKTREFTNKLIEEFKVQEDIYHEEVTKSYAQRGLEYHRPQPLTPEEASALEEKIRTAFKGVDALKIMIENRRRLKTRQKQ